jgi:hypothetical protein
MLISFSSGHWHYPPQQTFGIDATFAQRRFYAAVDSWKSQASEGSVVASTKQLEAFRDGYDEMLRVRAEGGGGAYAATASLRIFASVAETLVRRHIVSCARASLRSHSRNAARLGSLSLFSGVRR